MNAISPPAVLTCKDLEQLLAGVEPGAFLVPPRILRRVIKHDCHVGGLGLQVPHRKSYVIGREALLAIVSRGELGISPDRSLADVLILLPEPEPASLRKHPPGVLLRDYWRLLFHARVHVALLRRVQQGDLDDATLNKRVEQIGVLDFEEFEVVVRQENFLLPPGDQRTVYEELVSLYLELRFFASHLLPEYFPSVVSFEKLDRVLAQDVAAEALFEATRLPGADDPVPPENVQDEQRWWYRWLTARAEKASASGNSVRSAVLRQQSIPSASAEQQAPTRLAALAQIEKLAVRLHSALHLPDADAELWRQSLPYLLEPAAQGAWPIEARLLYDLQKICIDQERDIYAVDLIEWVRSLGRRPIVRPLPYQRLVLRVRYLRKALHRLTSAQLPDDHRLQLNRLLTKAIHQAEKKLRDELRPRISGALDTVGLKPSTCVEGLERDRLVEELLDRAVEQGFLNMGDLRDAIARNRLKLPDLRGPVEYVIGDPLLKGNRRLAEVADGVYRGGEIYLRIMQRFSSLFFGTRIGRLMTLYLVLPFGGAYLLLAGLDHTLLEWYYHFFGPLPRSLFVASLAGTLADPTGAGLLSSAKGLHESMRPHRLELLNNWSLPVLGLFFLGMLYWPWFRRTVAWTATSLVQMVRWPFWDLPHAVLRIPIVVLFLQSRVYAFLVQFLLKPLFWTAPVLLILYMIGAERRESATIGLSFFAIVSLLLNSRLGLHLEELTADTMARSWHRLRTNWLPDLFRFIIYLFKRLTEQVEKLLYTVDECLRFRGGDSRLSLVVKGVLGLVWWFITYIVRFVINLLVEPQINPIKHFPVVTVSHKMVVAFIVPPLAGLLQLAPFSMKYTEAVSAAIVIGALIPGIFGFLAWEFKENWRLYRATQSPTLDPVLVGHHGETAARLLRPGFHSGTIPHLYARWRTNLRRGKGQSARKQEEGLHEVTECLTRFIDRSLLALLAVSRSWGTSVPLELERIRLATGRIRFELACKAFHGERLVIDLELHSRWLLAGITQPAFLNRLHHEQRKAFADALAGFYKLAGVQLVREQLESPAQAPNSYWITRTELVPLDKSSPPVKLEPFLFSAVPIAWKDWVEVWERDLHGKGHDKPLLGGVRLLPVRAHTG
jgi:hypothetical protein